MTQDSPETARQPRSCGEAIRSTRVVRPRWLTVIGIVALLPTLGHSATPTAGAPLTKVEEVLFATRANLEERLIDYDNTRFRNVTVRDAGGSGRYIVCGEINGPNHFGGLTGWQRFVTTSGGPFGVMIADDQFSRQLARNTCERDTWPVDHEDYSSWMMAH